VCCSVCVVVYLLAKEECKSVVHFGASRWRDSVCVAVCVAVCVVVCVAGCVEECCSVSQCATVRAAVCDAVCVVVCLLSTS